MAKTNTTLGKFKPEAHLEPKTSAEIAYYQTSSSAPSLKEMVNNERMFKRDEQIRYKQMLDEQIRQSQLIKTQGTMSAVEKHINKGELKDFKNYHRKINSMLVGSFDESPMRANIIPTVVKPTVTHAMEKPSVKQSPKEAARADNKTPLRQPGSVKREARSSPAREAKLKEIKEKQATKAKTNK